MTSAFVFEPARLPQYELTVSVGEPQSPAGMTRVALRGDGQFLASHRGGSDDRREDGVQARATMAPADVEFVIRSVVQFDWSARFPPRPGIPDEAIVLWQLAGPNLPQSSVRMWLRDAENDKLAGEVLSVLRRTLAQASDERLFL